MTVREFANSILVGLRQPTLTDSEASFLPSEMDNEKIFNSLQEVMKTRGLTGTAMHKLEQSALLYGVKLSTTKKPSNIFIGSVLND